MSTMPANLPSMGAAPCGDEQPYKNIPLLDHGYLRFIEHWGSDRRIVETARMSTDGAFRGWGPVCGCCRSVLEWPEGQPEPWCPACQDVVEAQPGDERLLRYLYEHQHNTPFEFGGLTVEVQAPIMVFREWHRHRTQSYNEMSARYTPLPELYYIPTLERLLVPTGGPNKQASRLPTAEQLTREQALRFQTELMKHCKEFQLHYDRALANGVPKELARCGMPVNHYSRMRATANLRNWLAFLTLRMDTAAQWEIRQFANALGTFIKDAFPRTWGLFNERRAA